MYEPTLFVPDYNIGQNTGLQQSNWSDTTFPFEDNGYSSNFSDYLAGNTNVKPASKSQPFPWLWVIALLLALGGLFYIYKR